MLLTEYLQRNFFKEKKIKIPNGRLQQKLKGQDLKCLFGTWMKTMDEN